MMWKIEDMFGPTPEAQALQLAQLNAYDAWCTARYDARDAGLESTETVESARKAYDTSVTELLALLGDEAPCNAVDSELFSEYSDFYKEVTGCRPRHYITRREVQDWIARQVEQQRSQPD